MERDRQVQALLDKQEIYEVLARYLRSVDRGDVEALRACYLPGATEDHGGVFSGSAEDYVDTVARTIVHPKNHTMHTMSNVLIDLDGDAAHVESYVTTFARVRTSDGPGDSMVGGRLIDRMERRDGRWGIAHRAMIWEWNRDERPAEGWIFGLLVPDTTVLRRGAKFPDDPAYGKAR